VYTGVDLSKEEREKLKKYTKNIIIKGAESETSLLNDTDLFLHRTAEKARDSKQFEVQTPYDEATFFQKKKILLVDDDYRNVFALSKILTERGMEIIKAETGIQALEKLDTHPGIELVLMDIMMPEMDGYEAMRRIRAQEKFRDLPLIAVTAKAMNYDKQKCLDAGANDYITKPVEIDRLILIMAALLGKTEQLKSDKVGV
jgi:CheY-like chemotaxis protein